jgi:3-deoxy-manno-octulosonate cytidylyltransferase (CMP-KDO synthetase)
MHFIGIIPARYASTRFPGKPLVDLCGKTMIQRVYEQASNVLDTVIVATDDQRIYDCVKAFGGDVFMTSPDHQCGTDRVYEAYTLYREQTRCAFADSEMVVVNIQGDEPFIQPEQIQALMHCFPTEIATLVHPFTNDNTWDDLSNPNYVKVAVAHQYDHKYPMVIGKALYFSRSIVPYMRGVDSSNWLQEGKFYRHIGMYAYRADVLQRITQLPQSLLEKTESLEQLRWLENGLTIKVAESNSASIGIDTPADLEVAIQYLNSLNTKY